MKPWQLALLLTACDQTPPSQIKTSAEFNAEKWAVDLGFSQASANCSIYDINSTQFVPCTIRTETSIIEAECPYVKFWSFFETLYGTQPYCFVKRETDASLE